MEDDEVLQELFVTEKEVWLIANKNFLPSLGSSSKNKIQVKVSALNQKDPKTFDVDNFHLLKKQGS